VALTKDEAPPERRKRIDKGEYTRRVFVGGLPSTTTEEEFKVRPAHPLDAALGLRPPHRSSFRSLGRYH